MTQISFAPKTSTPDWMTDMSVCDCLMAMCPVCDPDFFYDMAQDFIPDDATPPFQEESALARSRPFVKLRHAYDTPKNVPKNVSGLCQDNLIIEWRT